MKKEIKENPYKNHKHDGGSMYRDVDCFGCEKEMLWYFKNRNGDTKAKVSLTNNT